MSSGKSKDKGTRSQLGLRHKKEENFPEWYSQVITSAEMIDYYDISGCYILRPWAYQIWEEIQGWFDGQIKALGVKNAYFPVFVSKSALEREADHVEGFAPEVAWVTRSGDSELKEHIAIRPTSETIMYPAFSKWISSHRDLPLRLNQWTNVVRWEFKNPTPFIRTREFLWQEGHSAFARREEADEEVLTILDLYARVYEELLAVPVIKGRKSEKEKFAGGLFTTTVEAFVPTTGRAIQGATSHGLGQNFAKMFDITFEDEQGKPAMVWQNSWGLTTRTIGVMVMVHGDDTGLVLPPRVAPVQVVLVGVVRASMSAEQQQVIYDECTRVERMLKAAGVRAYADQGKNHTAGWKYNHWEQKGVPVRIEIGPRDVESGTVMTARRDILGRAGKQSLPSGDELPAAIAALLETIQHDMLERARRERDRRMVIASEWSEFVSALRGGNLILAPWCERIACEEDVKKRTGPQATEAAGAGAGAGAAGETEDGEEGRGLTGAAKTLCLPFAQVDITDGTKCVACDCAATSFAMWGRSY